MRRRRRILIFAGGGAVLLATAIHLTFVAWLAHAIVDAPNRGRPLTAFRDATAEELARLGVNRSLRVAVGPPAASLSVWILEPRADLGRPRGTVLVLHGIRDRKTTMLGLGRLLSNQGFRAVLIDLRGHGDSTGDWLTYGIAEARDLSEVIDDLSRRGLLSGELGVYGPSFGGSVALQLAARDPRIRAIVVVSTFSSVPQAVTDYVRRTAPRWLVPQITIDQALRKADEFAGVKLELVSSVDAIARTRAACLILHGSADRLLPPRHAQQLQAASGGRASLRIIEGAGHGSIFAPEGSVVSRETAFWFHRYLASSEDLSDLH